MHFFHHVAMVVIILDYNNKEPNKENGDNSKDGKKNDRLILSKYVHNVILLPTWNFLILRARSMTLVNTAQKFSFSFSKLRYGSLGFNPRECRQHLAN